MRIVLDTNALLVSIPRESEYRPIFEALINGEFNLHLIALEVGDDKFVDCAVSGNDDYLFTDDKHFRVLANVKFPLIKVIITDELAHIKKNHFKIPFNGTKFPIFGL